MRSIKVNRRPRLIESVRLIVFTPSSGDPQDPEGCIAWFHEDHRPLQLNYYEAFRAVYFMNFRDFDTFEGNYPDGFAGLVQIDTTVTWIDENGDDLKTLATAQATPVLGAQQTPNLAARYGIIGANSWLITDTGDICGIRYKTEPQNCTITLDLVNDPLIIRCVGNDERAD